MTHYRTFEKAGDDTCRWVDMDMNGTIEYGGEMVGPRRALMRFMDATGPSNVFGITQSGSQVTVYYRRGDDEEVVRDVQRNTADRGIAQPAGPH